MTRKFNPNRLLATSSNTPNGCILSATPNPAVTSVSRHAVASHGVANTQRYEFLANMNHEIRAPLNGVLGMAELLARSDLDSRQKAFVEVIVKSGNALRTVINDLLDFSMIDAGQIKLDTAPFHLTELIENTAIELASEAREKNLELILRIQPDLHGHYIGDAERLRQIILNLLGNAIKFTDTGHVLIDIKGEDAGTQSMLHIAVIDTGVGIPSDIIPRIFDTYGEAASSLTRRHHGTRLGLAIASRLVAMMEGKISVFSHDGHGSTFHVTLCLPHAPKKSQKPTVMAEVSGARILVIDDNPVSRTSLTEQMIYWGFNACAAQSGEEGLNVLMAAAALKQPPDCLVLDYQMPGMSGVEMIRIIHETPEITGCPIIMLLPHELPLNSPSYRALPIDRHIIKPARSAVLHEAIVSLVQNSRTRLNARQPAAY